MKNADYYNDKTYSFNCKSADGTDADFSKGINHAVSIVGWDDGFSCENYNGKNRMNGAWICKNSYGSKWGKNGYFYLSYSYTDYFLYSAAVEVTRYPEIASVKSADKPHLSFRKAGAVGFRYGSEIKNAEVTVSVKGASAQTLKADVSNGYTFVPIASPVYNSGIKVSVNGSELADSAISIYYIKSGSPLASPSKPLQEDNWDEAVENLNIDVSETSFTADSLVNMNTVKHIVKLNSVDNRFTIIPEDGYVFTDDTKVYIERKVYGREDPEIISGKISELKDELDFTDGRLIVKSKYIGDAFARGMRIDLDESSKIKDVFLIKDNGSGSRLEPESYSIETSPETIPDSGSYYAKITLNGYYVTDDFKVIVSRDGKNNEYPPADIKVEGATVTAGVIIEIPDITQDIIQTLKTLLHIFAILLAPLGLNG